MTYTVLVGEGFNLDNTPASLGIRYNTTINQLSIVGTTPRRPGLNYAGTSRTITAGSVVNNLGSLPTLRELLTNYRTISVCFGALGNPYMASVYCTAIGIAENLVTSSTVLGRLKLGICMFNNQLYAYLGASNSVVLTAILPSVSATVWRQFELQFVSDAPGSFSGKFKLYVDEELIFDVASTLVSADLDAEIFASPHIRNLAGSSNVARGAVFDGTTDFVVAVSDSAEERMGETYVDVLPTDTDVDTTGWNSSIGSTVLANDVNKNNLAIATPFIETSIDGATAEFSSSNSYPSDGRLIRAVTVAGAGQSNTDTMSVSRTINGEVVGDPTVLELGTQTPINPEGGLGWLSTNPATDAQWQISEVNTLEFGIRRNGA